MEVAARKTSTPSRADKLLGFFWNKCIYIFHKRKQNCFNYKLFMFHDFYLMSQTMKQICFLNILHQTKIN